jgi:aminopeptidase N
MTLRPRLLAQLPILLGIAVLINACSSQKETTASGTATAVVAPEAAEPEPEITERERYQESRERKFDLIHTKLNVSFNYDKMTLDGKAELTLKPYFYNTNTLVLDAKGFDIRVVGLKGKGNMAALPYTYDGQQMNITLDKTYSNKDTLRIWVDYTAKPEELKAEGSEAITDAKGLYFINPKGAEANKPTQIWTQGETEASSAWFPTIDAPNENTTQEIVMTVDKKYVTLSNGLLIDSKDNGNGTRTDTWKQTKPHAPYLAMMAVGDFAVINDKWKNIAVDYYVEHEYAQYGKAIFGETPAMLEFYSNVLDYQYPWDKYAQIVVRDYVSGAMENTTAVIHGEFLHRTDRELLDGDNERIIAHELFHHWFGDIVTCESWANLPLNESFATYGEYMWLEHRHGRAAADRHSEEQMGQYFASTKQQGHVDLIRFNYEDKEDMFDAHSYNKGGRVLHMLRKTIGDDAFFKALSVYLKAHQYEAVEIHQLRLAMEKVTGQDLNWFFNQWFLNQGHPDLAVKHAYDAAKGTHSVILTQEHDLKEFPLYRIPLDVDIYSQGIVKRERIELDSKTDTFTFKVAAQPDLVIVDAERMLLGTIKDKLTEQQALFQLKNAPLYQDKVLALGALRGTKDQNAVAAMFTLLENDYQGLRIEALKGLKSATVSDTSLLKNRLIFLTQSDPKAPVRAEAVGFLADKFGKDANVKMIVEKAVTDRSYNVAGSALRAMATYDKEKALLQAGAAEGDAKGNLVSAIAGLYAKHGGVDQMNFFLNGFTKISDPGEKYGFIQTFGKYLLRQESATQLKGVGVLEGIALNDQTWWMRLSAIQVLAGMQQKAEGDAANSAALLSKLNEVMAEVKAKETNEMIKGMLGQ